MNASLARNMLVEMFYDLKNGYEPDDEFKKLWNHLTEKTGVEMPKFLEEVENG